MSYLAFKHLHLTCVGLSAALFFVRGLLMLWRSWSREKAWALPVGSSSWRFLRPAFLTR